MRECPDDLTIKDLNLPTNPAALFVSLPMSVLCGLIVNGQDGLSFMAFMP